MKLTFKKAKTEKDIKSIHDYNIDAFSDSPDFKWTFEEIKKEVADGWELYSLISDTEVVAAVFFKVEGDSLLTKNTAIKIDHQGAGLSHSIKEFFEKTAREHKLKKIYHYCRIDNFRMYSLNESHQYKKTPKKLGPGGLVVEWVKNLK
jgi:N-acetylglutamate synthase-like GNAT family acetyltransferase